MAGYWPAVEGFDDGGSRISGPLTKRYSPDQPRDELGRWTDAGGGQPGDATIADEGASGENERPRLADPKAPGINRVDLHEEEGFGHTKRDHVGKTDEELLARLRAERWDVRFLTVYRWKYGAFDSFESANDLVNRTLEENDQKVDDVATGQLSKAILVRRFGYQTGRELFLLDPDGEPRVRPTYEVEVRIEHDPYTKSGFRVRTAFPRNSNPRE